MKGAKQEPEGIHQTLDFSEDKLEGSELLKDFGLDTEPPGNDDDDDDSLSALGIPVGETYIHKLTRQPFEDLILSTII